MTQRLSGKVALVTGASSGLGEAISRRFIAEGASVVLTDVDAAAGTAVAKELGSAARFQRHDVTREADWLDALNLAKTAFGKLDVLVNNAGITTMGSVEDLTVEQFRQMLDIDLIGVFLGCKHCIPFMNGMQCLQPRNTPIRSMSSICRNCSTVSSSTEPMVVMPALLTSTSSLPKAVCARFRASSQSASRVTS